MRLVAAFLTAALLTSSAEESKSLTWHDQLRPALEESRQTGKPILLEFRCAPCVNGREFDAKIFFTPPASERGKLLQKYVRARVTSMSGIDIAHYTRDWHNSLYYFVINSDEDIYLRYGGRDAQAADTYLDFDSFSLALKLGLEEHQRFLRGETTPPPRSEPRRPYEIPSLKRDIIDQQRCTECHLIADYTMREKEAAGLLDPIRDLYQSPDIRQLGIHLDIPKGLVILRSEGPAAAAGILPGDLITSVESQRVLTFGDLQYRYNQLNRAATTVELGISRNGESSRHTITLPFEWWRSSIDFRHWTVEPLLLFESQALSPKDKERLELPLDGFAARVTAVDIEAILNQHHQLEIGDIITHVDGVARNPRTRDLPTHIKLSYQAGDELPLDILRDGAELTLPLKTRRQNFRKPESQPSNPSLNWSEPAVVRHGSATPVTYRGTITNGHLLIEADHAPGWHSFALDNPARAAKAATPSGNQELPTVIRTQGIETSGPWKQTPPVDLSKPDIHWFSWGFKGRAHYAIKLASPPKAPIEVTISSQVCDDQGTTCGGTSGLKLTIPVPGDSKPNLGATITLGSLEAVLTN